MAGQKLLPTTGSPENNKTKQTLVQDPELQAMNRIHKILSGLTDLKMRTRVIAWMAGKFGCNQVLALADPEIIPPEVK
jgi:hypothetical protein